MAEKESKKKNVTLKLFFLKMFFFTLHVYHVSQIILTDFFVEET